MGRGGMLLWAALATMLAAWAPGARGGRGDLDGGGRGVGASLRKLSQDSDVVPRIAGGAVAPCGRFPYMVSLNNRQNVHKCGAVLVHAKWVLTAAHCVDPQSPDTVGAAPVVIIGACSLDDYENENGRVEIVQPKRTVIHKRYTGRPRDGYDIALLKLQKASIHTPVSLPPKIHKLPESQHLLILGWGVDENGNYPRELKQSRVDLVRHSLCNAEGVWGGKVKNSMLCAFDVGGDVCQGDSGGPLLHPFVRNGNLSEGSADVDVVVGITSFGDDQPCGAAKKPSVYIRVSSFVSWIEGVMKGTHQAVAPTPSELSPAPGPQPASDALPASSKPNNTATKEFRAAMYLADEGGGIDPVEVALMKGADVNAPLSHKDLTALMLAAMIGNVELMELLLQFGARVDDKDMYGGTALYIASIKGAVSAVRVLIDANADLDSATRNGFTPLMAASLAPNIRIVEDLLDAGAEPNKTNRYGLSPLHYASGILGFPNKEIADSLLDNDAYIDAKSNNGRTPIYEASFFGNIGMVRFLVDRGANPSVADSKNRSAIDVVCMCLSVEKNYGECSIKTCNSSNGRKRIKKILM